MNSKELDESFYLLEKYELSIAKLYETFAHISPEVKDTWMVFSMEERLHAQWINGLYSHVKEGRIQLKQAKITSQSTKMAIDYIENQIEKTSKEKPDLKQLVIIAIGIEKSMLESPFFKMFELTDYETKKVRERLTEATIAHMQRLIRWRERIETSAPVNKYDRK